MGNVRPDPLRAVAFVCSACRHAFEAEPGRVESAPEQDHHPFSYSHTCPECGGEACQAGWQRGLLKAWANSTGPRTPEGKARTAANLEGHPTPEEAQRTRFNAMKHGLFSRVATHFPAKPGHYPHCETCEHLETRACVPQRACLKRTELFLRHQVAFEQGDPRQLLSLRGDTQAAIQALVDDMLLAIAIDGGPRLKSPQWYYDKEGGFHLAQFIDENTGEVVQLHEIKEHPLLKRLMDFIAKNHMTLEDMEMTPKARDEQEALQGFLDGQKGEQQTALEYQERNTQLLEQLSDQISRSQQDVKRDPVLIEHGEAAQDE